MPARESRRPDLTVCRALELNSVPFIMSPSVVASRTFFSDTSALTASMIEL